MSIYGDNTAFGNYIPSYFTETPESVMEDSSIKIYSNCDLLEEGYKAIGIMNENYNRLMTTIGISELSSIETTGRDMVYTEGVLSSLGNSIKNFLKKIWERIKSLFKHFMMIIDSYLKTDKEFCNKYRQQIMAYKNLDDFTFKGYKWTIVQSEVSAALDECTFAKAKAMIFKDGEAHLSTLDDVSKLGDPGNNTTKDAYKKALEYFDDSFEVYRGNILDKFNKGKTGSYTSEEFRKELRAIFRNGEESKEELDDKDIDVHDWFGELQNGNKTRKEAKDSFNTCKKSIESDIKDIDRFTKTHIKDNLPAKDGETTTIKDKGKLSDDEIPNIIEYLDATDKTVSVTLQGSTNSARKQEINDNSDIVKVKLKVNDQGKVKGENKSKQLALASKVMHATKECLLAIYSAQLEALKERSRQYKACLTKIVYHKHKEEGTYNESTDYSSYSGSTPDYLASINFK